MNKQTKIWEKIAHELKWAHWLNGERIRIASIMAITAYVATIAYMLLLPHMFKSADGEYLIVDFLSFWTAAKLALSGDFLTPFLTQNFLDLQTTLTEQSKVFAFFYPPTWLLYILPLGLVSNLLAFLIFSIVSALLLFAFGTALFQNWKYGILLLGLPTVVNCLMHGQNGAVSASLLGGAMLCLHNRKFIWAGILIGLLSYKPQLGLIIPLALIFGQYWRTFFAASITTLGLALLSALIFGIDSWFAFFDQLPTASLVLREGVVSWSKMVSLYASVRVMGGSDFVAWLVQSVLSLFIIWLVFQAWRPLYKAAQAEQPNINAMAGRSAILIGGILLFTPFALSYDFLILVIPFGYLLRAGMETEFLSYEKTMMAVFVMLSATASFLAEKAGFPVAPLVPALIIWMGWRRLRMPAQSKSIKT